MKSTKAQLAQRVEQVFKLRLLGAIFHDIKQYASETDAETGRPWNVSERQLWTYIERSNELLKQTLEADRDKLLARHVAQRRALYARAFESADWRTALAVLKDEAELEGLYPPRKTALTTPDGMESNGANGPLARILAEYLPRLRSAVDRLRPPIGDGIKPGNGRSVT